MCVQFQSERSYGNRETCRRGSQRQVTVRIRTSASHGAASDDIAGRETWANSKAKDGTYAKVSEIVDDPLV